MAKLAGSDYGETAMHGGDDYSPAPAITEPSNLYRNTQFEEIGGELLEGLRQRQGFLLLTGDPGVGKAVLIRHYLGKLRELRCIFVTSSNLDFPDLINYLCANLHLSAEHLDARQQVQAVLEELATCAAQGQSVVLIITNAHHLHPSALRRLHEFVSTPQHPAQRLQVILCGSPELENRLLYPELQALQASITTRCHLQALSDTDSASFIYQQFANTQHAGGLLLSPEVIGRMNHYCRGIPGSLAMLCDTTLLFAGLDPHHEITTKLVDEAAKSCFVNEAIQPFTPSSADPNSRPLTMPDLGLSFDFDLEQTLKTDALTLDIAGFEDEPLTSWIDQELSANPQEQSVTPTAPAVTRTAADLPPALRTFLQLVADVQAKQLRKTAALRSELQGLLDHYLHVLHNGAEQQLSQCEQRILRLQNAAQPILLSLAAIPATVDTQESILYGLIINPSWWLYREICLRVHSADLALSDGGQVVPVRLLDGRDGWVVTCSYRHLRDAPASLWLEVALCDHRGEWSAYTNQQEICLDHPSRAATPKAENIDYFAPNRPPSGVAPTFYTLPLELEQQAEQTQQLRTTHAQTLNRATPLTRALLSCLDPAQAPARIELVARPFMLFGRQSAAAGAGFGDFTLGFVPKYSRISRLHCVICALGDQLALMAPNDQGQTYTGCNGQRLAAGEWLLLNDADFLEICDLYRLQLRVVRDQQADQHLDWDINEPRERLGNYVLNLVEMLHQRDQQADNSNLRANLRNRYLHLLHMQDRVAELNGVGTPGSILYVCFQRDDAASQQVAHYYVPKWLPIGSATEDGLRLHAPDVQPHHAELLFRDGAFWLQNLGAAGSVQVGCHGLAPNEVVGLASGDTLAIGAVRFTFDGY